MQNPKAMKQLQQMNAKIAQMQQDLETIEVQGTAGGGAVTASANGSQRLTALTLEPEVLEEGAELLADMVLAACNAALDASRKVAADQMSQLTAGLGLPPGLL